MSTLTLASSSPTRQSMLLAAGIDCSIVPVRIDEVSIRDAMVADEAKPRDIADTLAEFKARKCSEKIGPGLVLGCDQILSLEQQVYGKPDDRGEAAEHLRSLSGHTHQLHSAAVMYEGLQASLAPCCDG